jgi:hypothetical protein
VEKQELQKLLSKHRSIRTSIISMRRLDRAIAKHIRDLHKLINYLFESARAARLFDHRAAQGALEEGAICSRPDRFAEGRSELVGFEPPAIVMPGKPN